MKLRQMKYIIAVVDCGSISAAAKHLFISQQALSSFVAKTERELGVKLFERNGPTLALTYAGEVYIRSARQIISSCDKMERQIKDIVQNKSQRLRLGASDMLLSYIAPTVLKCVASNEQYGDVVMFPGSLDTLLDDLKQYKLDICILPFVSPPEKYYCRLLGSLPLHVVAKRGYLSSKQLNIRPDLRSIADVPILIPPASDSMRFAIDEVFASADLVPSNLIECPSRVAALRMAASGLGIAIDIAPSFSVIRLGEDADIIPLASGTQNVKLWILSRMGAIVGRLTELVESSLKEVFDMELSF